MTRPTSPADVALRIERLFHAPREKVFSAWVEASALARWFAPSADMKVTVHELDVRPGGRYRITMEEADGVGHTVIGTYREIQAPERLVFSWRWEGMDMAETLVSIRFVARGDATQVILQHDALVDADLRGKHDVGWQRCLDRLRALLST